MKTPVWTALAALIVNIAINLYVVSRYGIVSLAGATAVSASLNCLLLYAMLHPRGWFRFPGKLALRVGRPLVAVAALAARLSWMIPRLADHYCGSVFKRLCLTAPLVRRQLVAVAAMAALLWWMMPRLADHYGGSVFERIWSLAALVGAGGAVFFAAAFLVGALDKDLLAMLTRRRARSEAAPSQE